MSLLTGEREASTYGLLPVEPDRRSRSAESIEDAILRALIYYDLFDYPLTTDEIERYLDIPISDRRPLLQRLNALDRKGVIVETDGFWSLAGREEKTSLRRPAMERRGVRLWGVAEQIGRIIRLVPFVRGVMISGGLSRYVADERSDIDYFIVTAPGRLWIARTLLVLFRRTLLLNRRTWLCTNYFVTEDNLAIRERTLYAACETASVRPLWNRGLYNRFVAENGWIETFYPNHSPPPELFMSGLPEKRSLVQRLLEQILPSSIWDRCDRRAMERTRKHWERKYPDMPEKIRAHALRSTPDESRSHAGDYAPIVLERYRAALIAHNVPRRSTVRSSSQESG